MTQQNDKPIWRFRVNKSVSVKGVVTTDATVEVTIPTDHLNWTVDKAMDEYWSVAATFFGKVDREYPPPTP